MSGKNTRILVVDEVQQYINLEKKLTELQAVSGMNLDELIEKFVKGYVLVSPFAAGEIKDKLDLYTTNYTKLETLYD
jgi:hypothetical protein